MDQNNDTYKIDEFIRDGEFYDSINPSTDDLSFYRKWCSRAAGPVLELGCGTGRLTVPLAQEGFSILGLDNSKTMLARACAKAESKALSVRFIEGDMREFSLDEKFASIIIPFHSLQCVYSPIDAERVFANVLGHLLPGGLFIFDIFNPDFQRLAEKAETPEEIRRCALEDGREIVVSETYRYDAAGQVNRIVWHIKIGEQQIRQRLDLRCYFPLEMDMLLQYNGFEVLHKFGSFAEGPFSAKSEKQIYVCAHGPLPPHA